MLYQAPSLLTNEQDILNEAFRKQVLEEIASPENKARKHEAFRRHQQYKDRTHLYVVEMLLKQFQKETVAEMQYALSNISFLRKIVNKLAKVYNNGVQRKVEIEGQEQAKQTGDVDKVDPYTKAVEDLAKLLKVNRSMKKANRYVKFQKNGLVYVKPQKEYDGKFTLALPVMAPFLYDVIPDPANPECPLVVILSHYQPQQQRYYDVIEPAIRGNEATVVTGANNRNEAIADSASDEMGPPEGDFIWWSPQFHFTTDAKGAVKPAADNPDNRNPIMELPFVQLSDDQDGAYWAQGGEDLSEMSIRINALLTHLNHVSVTQGYGQLYMTGSKLPKNVQVGPNHVLQGEYAEGEPKPEFGFIGANPPLEQIMKVIEGEAALLLTTNNLTTSGFSLSLQGGQQFASGIALMIDKAESIEDTEEQAEQFVDAEPMLWEKIFKWKKVLNARGALCEEIKAIPDLPEKAVVTVTFPPVQPVQAETERLDVYKKRKDLGINSLVDIIMRDNPGMSRDAAKAKLEEIQAENQSRMENASLPGQEGDQPADGSNQPEGGAGNQQEEVDQEDPATEE